MVWQFGNLAIWQFGNCSVDQPASRSSGLGGFFAGGGGGSGSDPRRPRQWLSFLLWRGFFFPPPEAPLISMVHICRKALLDCPCTAFQFTMKGGIEPAWT